jgi:hypothetical protein
MRKVSSHFEFAHLIHLLHRDGPGRSSMWAKGVCRGVQSRDNDEMARRGSTARRCRQYLKASYVSERKQRDKLSVPQSHE